MKNEKNKDDPKEIAKDKKKLDEFLNGNFKSFSFEISNHTEIYYNKKDSNDVDGKKFYSVFIKSLLLKFFDLAEGAYNTMTLEEFSKMEFY